MDDPFLQMLREWETYYLMMGSAAAVLIGLLFVAVSLGASLITPNNTEGLHSWATPILVHFSAVLFISALIVVPTLTPTSLGGFLALAAIANLFYLVLIAARLRQQSIDFPVEPWDWIWNIVVPAVSHLLILGTAIALLANTGPTLDAVALAVAMIIATGIRNTWDLTVWIAQQRRSDE